ncbi:MAG: flagellar biosynthetic protein FliO [Pseudomonadota bacterium]
MDITQAARMVFALAFVLVLLGAAAVLVRRMGLVKGATGFQKKRRLSLVEVLPIDAKRRAAIIRCDDREHLVVLNQNSATVIARDMPPPEEVMDTDEADSSLGEFKSFVEKAAEKLKGAA